MNENSIDPLTLKVELAKRKVYFETRTTRELTIIRLPDVKITVAMRTGHFEASDGSEGIGLDNLMEFCDVLIESDGIMSKMKFEAELIIKDVYGNMIYAIDQFSNMTLAKKEIRTAVKNGIWITKDGKILYYPKRSILEARITEIAPE